MTTPIPATLFADPAPAQRLERAATALAAHGFTVEILDDAAAARTRIKEVVPDLSTALRRVEDHCLPLESARAQAAYGWPSAINRLLILNAEPHPGRGTVLLLREAIGF